MRKFKGLSKEKSCYVDICILLPNNSDIHIKAVLDTGATHSILSSEFLKQNYNLDPIDFVDINTVGGQAKLPIVEVTLKVTQSNGKIAVFQRMPVLISSELDDPIGGGGFKWGHFCRFADPIWSMNGDLKRDQFVLNMR